MSTHQTPDGRNFFGWVAPVRQPRLFVSKGTPPSLIEEIPALSMAEVYAIRDASPVLCHADRMGFTILMPGTFNQDYVDREVARGGLVVEGRR